MPKPLKLTRNITVSDITTSQNSDGVEVLTLSGCAYKYKDDSGKYFIDADWENVDTNQLDLSRLFSTNNTPLLFNHDHTQIVGKIIAADKRRDGLYITAEIYNFPNDPLSEYIVPRVKKGLINSFSIGFLVHEVDVIEQDDTEYLQISKGEMIECSLVAVPANSNAVFDIVGQTEKGVTFGISKGVLKEDNPNICTDLESCGLLQKARNATKNTNSNDDTILLNENKISKGSEMQGDKELDKETNESQEPKESDGQPQTQDERQPEEGNNEPSSEKSDTQSQEPTTESNESVGEPKAEPKDEPKEEPEPQPKEEPKEEPKVEPKVQDEPKVEPKEEPKTEPKEESHKPTIQEVIQTLREVDVEDMSEDDLGDLIETILPFADMFYEAVEAGLQEELQSA